MLRKHNVDTKVDEYLIAKGMLMVVQLAGLADSKADVGEGICLPAGLDPKDRPLCQPVKAAWQEAEALVSGELDLIRKGKMGDLDDPIEPEVRIKKTNTFTEYYNIRLPAHLIGSDSLAGRCLREYERKAPNVQYINKVKSLAYRPRRAPKDLRKIAA